MDMPIQPKLLTVNPATGERIHKKTFDSPDNPPKVTGLQVYENDEYNVWCYRIYLTNTVNPSGFGYPTRADAQQGMFEHLLTLEKYGIR